jgi:hypothetical protein
MIRTLRTIRTVVLVAVALVVLAVAALVGWWVAIAPTAAASWETPPPAASPRTAAA